MGLNCRKQAVEENRERVFPIPALDREARLLITLSGVRGNSVRHSLCMYAEGSLPHKGRFLSKPQLARISPREEPRVRQARAGGHPGASPLNDCVFSLASRIRGHDVSSFLSVKAYP